jgi:hypothetical protein
MPTRKYPTRHRRQGQQLTPEEKAQAREKFLDAFAKTGNVSQSASYADVDRGTVYDWRNTDPVFAAKFADAELEANDVIRAEIHRRAIEGWEEPVVSAGKLVTHVRKYSDTLLTLLARARMPEFRDKLDVNGNLTVGAYRMIEQASQDAETTQLASQLLTRLALPGPNTPGSPSTRDDPSGPARVSE